MNNFVGKADGAVTCEHEIHEPQCWEITYVLVQLVKVVLRFVLERHFDNGVGFERFEVVSACVA